MRIELPADAQRAREETRRLVELEPQPHDQSIEDRGEIPPGAVEAHAAALRWRGLLEGPVASEILKTVVARHLLAATPPPAWRETPR